MVVILIKAGDVVQAVHETDGSTITHHLLISVDMPSHADTVVTLRFSTTTSSSSRQADSSASKAVNGAQKNRRKCCMQQVLRVMYVSARYGVCYAVIRSVTGAFLAGSDYNIHTSACGTDGCH